MKKEKGNLTLKQLEKRKRIVLLVGMLSSLLMIISMICLFVSKFNVNTNSSKTVLILISICCIPICISQILSEEYDKQIEIKEKKIKVKTIKNLAKEGNLKETVTIKQREIIEYILFVGIEKVVIQGIAYKASASSIIKKDVDFTVNIYLKNGCCIRSVLLPSKKFMELLNPKLEERILDILITHINLSQEAEGDTELTIEGKDEFVYYQESAIKDHELLDIFEFKEE